MRTPGTVFLSPETYRAVLTDMADALNAKWKAAGADARAHAIPEYYNYDEVEKFEESALGIHEKMEGLHFVVSR